MCTIARFSVFGGAAVKRTYVYNSHRGLREFSYSIKSSTHNLAVDGSTYHKTILGGELLVLELLDSVRGSSTWVIHMDSKFYG